MKPAVADLFSRYEQLYAESLVGKAGADAFSALYTADIIAAGPQGVLAGKTADFLAKLMKGFDHYRMIGTQRMRIADLRVVPIDAAHCVAHASWSALYERDDLPPVTIGFEVHYLVRVDDGTARVFGWIADDEEAALRRHGVI